MHTLGENVASMTASDRDAFSDLYRSIPVELCSGSCSPVKRSRLYWISWPLAKSADLSYSTQGSVVIATLRGSYPERAGRLERLCWSRTMFRTFRTCSGQTAVPDNLFRTIVPDNLFRTNCSGQV